MDREASDPLGMDSFAQRLITWQHTHGRHDLPWQGADAYRVWLSEIMLQQTQVATVIPYYQRFVASFPGITALAAASEEQVLAHWSGLGYYARGRNLHKAARIIVEKYQGKFPCQFEQILALPGIGRSTAAAICALAYHERRAILDGNVKRVLARYCGVGGWAGNKKVEELLWQHANALLPQYTNAAIDETTGGTTSHPTKQPENGCQVVGYSHSAKPSSWQVAGYPAPAGIQPLNTTGLPPARERREKYLPSNSDISIYTQSLMDLGATICTRTKPKCGQCPAQADCLAFQTDAVHALPTPRPRKAVPERRTTFLLVMHGNDILLEKRPGSGIWGGLWCPPQLGDGSAEVVDYLGRNGMTASETTELAEFTHTFTHFKLHINPVLLRVVRKPQRLEQAGSMWLGMDEALQAAIPAPVRKMLRMLH